MRSPTDTNQASEAQELKQELSQLGSDLQKLIKKAGIAAYNLERSFVDNVKEISGKGRTAEEARKFWGIDDQSS